MDSLKTLMDKKSYDLVIKLTENSDDPISLFYRLSALLAVGQTDNALNLIVTKRKILQNKLSLLIKFHIEILCLLGKFDEAYEELKYYEDLPYESQEVEEILRSMPGYIRHEEKKSYHRGVNEEEIQKQLFSNNDEEVLAALDAIKNLSINPYLMQILKIIRTHKRQIIRSFALLLLVNAKYDKEVTFLHYDKLINVTPSLLKEPFNIQGYQSLEEFSYDLQSFYHDPSIASYALNIISSYLLYIYPSQITFSKEEALIIFGYSAKSLLKIDISDLNKICEEHHLDYSIISSKIKEIEEDLNNF